MENNSELEELRKRKLEQLQQMQEAQLEQQQREAQARAQIEALLEQHLTPEALERWRNAKLGNPQIAYTAAVSVIRSAQAGHVQHKLTDTELKSLLVEISQRTTRETKITRR